MDKQEKLKEILFSEFDKLIEGADIYDHRGSKWIIFTNEKRWVVEFTKEKTLWFNYHRFNEVLVLFAMDCNEDRNYIKEWYEKRFIFNQKVIYTEYQRMDPDLGIEDTIQNGVRSALIKADYKDWIVENTIQNGVRSTKLGYNRAGRIVENTIQNGVRSTSMTTFMVVSRIEDTIQNGVKETLSNVHPYPKEVRDTIENGVKDTNYRLVFDQQGIECAIENNINELDPRFFQLDGIVEDTIQNGIKRVGGVKRDRKERIELTIEKGEKS